MPKTCTPERWAEIRRALGTDQFRLLWIKPEENVLLGWWRICQYLGIRDRKTMVAWIDNWAMPAIKRPDGVWMTTQTAIDQWIMLAAQVTHVNKINKSDGPNSKNPMRHVNPEPDEKGISQTEVDGRRAEIAVGVVRQEALSRPVG